MKKYPLFIFSTLLAQLSFSQTWVQVQSGTTNILNSCDYATGNTIYITGLDQTLLKSIDGGISFTSVNQSGIDQGQLFSACSFTDANTGFIVSANYSQLPSDGHIYKTTDGGNTWATVYNSVLSLNDIQSPSSQVSYAIGGEASSGIIVKTTDGGNSWSELYSNPAEENLLTSAHFCDEQTGFVVGNNEWPNFIGKIIPVSGGNATSGTDLPGYTLFTDVFFFSPDTGFVSGFGGGANLILKTTDGGNSWSIKYSGNEVKSISFGNKWVGYAVGNGTILKTVDGGETWSEVASPVNSDFYSIQMSGPSQGIIVGADGTILRLDNGLPNPAFELSTSACSDQEINLQNNSIGAGSYTWSMPGASPSVSSSFNPTITYNMPGTYTISLTATNTAGSQTVQQTVVVNPTPSAPSVTSNSPVNSAEVVTLHAFSTPNASYQWSGPNGFNASGQDVSFIGNSGLAGTYCVSASANGCTSNESCVEVVVEGYASIDENTAHEINVFPNPCTTLVQVEVANPANSYKIYDAIGKIYDDKRFAPSVKFQVDLTSYPAGIYYVHIISNQSTLVKAVVKQ